MKPVRYLYPILIAATLTASCSAGQKKSAEETPSKYALMAGETLDSIYAHYGVEGENLLRENYPNDEFYRATYLAGDDNNSPKPFSYLWPYSSTVSAVRAIYDATGDSAYLTLLQEKVAPGLEEYLDTARMPAAYASYISRAPQSDRFYDDNIWLGIDFTDFYLGTKDPAHLDKARMIWEFIESGTDDKLGGGIYWCEQKKGGKNTCSNAPATVLCMKLYNLTQDNAYLEQAKKTYDWTKNSLRDPEDFVYWDNVRLDGSVDKAKYTYNSGQMIQAGVLLYQQSGDKAYLKDAQETARGAYQRFTEVRKAVDGTETRFYTASPWFNVILLRGLTALYEVDHNPEYIRTMADNARYAWDHTRDVNGFLDNDWTGIKTKEHKWLLDNACMVELFSEINNIK